MDGFVRIYSLSHPSMWALVGAFSVIVKTLPKFGLQGYTAGPFTNADADSVANVFLQFQQYCGVCGGHNTVKWTILLLTINPAHVIIIKYIFVIIDHTINSS